MTEHETPQGFQRIVVGYDGSPQADDAVALALQLLAPSGRLVLTNVYPFYRAWAFAATPGMYADLLHSAARDALDAVSETLDPRIRRTLIPLSDSSVARGINEVAESERADLIVLGSTHHGGAARLAGRTTVQRLLHGAPCAVAVAADGQRGGTGPIHRIGVAYDGSPEARGALEVAFALARRDGASVHICRAEDTIPYDVEIVAGEEEERQLRALADRQARADVDEAVAAAPPGIRTDGAIGFGPSGETVLAECGDADLLVCGSRTYGPLRRVLAGSTALAIVAGAACPVLIVPRTNPAAAAQPPEAVGAIPASKEI